MRENADQNNSEYGQFLRSEISKNFILVSTRFNDLRKLAKIAKIK